MLKMSTLRNFKPNPLRQAILVGLAFVGIGIGYGVGYLLQTDLYSSPLEVKDRKKSFPNLQQKVAQPKPPPAAKPVLCWF